MAPRPPSSVSIQVPISSRAASHSFQALTSDGGTQSSFFSDASEPGISRSPASAVGASVTSSSR